MKKNEENILLALFEGEASSKFELVKRTGLSPFTVYKHIKTLIAEGFIEETKVNKRKKSVKLSLKGLALAETLKQAKTICQK